MTRNPALRTIRSKTCWRVLDGSIPTGRLSRVSADDLATDLTGFQFLETESFLAVQDWLRPQLENLRLEALQAASGIWAQAQPPSAKAPLDGTPACLGCGLGAFIWFGVFKFVSDRYLWVKVGGTPLMILTFGLLLLPVILTWATVRRKGCEVDRQAHQKAREYLVKALTR